MTVDLRLLSPGAVTPKLTAKLRRLATDLDRIAVAAAANSSIAHGQEDRAKDDCVSADGRFGAELPARTCFWSDLRPTVAPPR